MTDPSEANTCFAPARLNGLTLRNRLIKAATFEGRTPAGTPGEALTCFHERFAQGGIGMTTLAYCAAEADGRLHEDTLYLHEGIREPLTDFTRRIHAMGTAVCGQLTHCGGFTKNAPLQTRRPLGPSASINLLGLGHGMPIVDALTTAQIRARVGEMGSAAAFMRSVGFDAIELHLGHGYGINQFISPRTNRRKDTYGGSLINRMRFALEVVAAIREQVGESFPLLAKISMSEGVRGGTSVDEATDIAAMLEQGGIDAVVCSAGSSAANPMMIFRGESLLPGLLQNEPNAAIRMVMRAAGPFMFKHLPYRDLYLLDSAQRIRDRVACGVCYVGGACNRAHLDTLMRAGFDFVQLGRALLFDPDLPRNVQNSQDYVNGCTHCNLCASLIEAPEGIRCVLRG